MERKQIQARSVKSLLDKLTEEFGPDWYQKVKVRFIKESVFEIVAEVSPIDEIEQQLVEQITMNHQKVKLPDLSELEAKYAQPIIRVEISKDEMTAGIIIVPGLKRSLPTVEEVEKALMDAGVKYGIYRQKIEQALKEKNFFTPIPVAFGKSPKPPVDAQIKLLFPQTGYLMAQVDESGRIDPASVYKIFTCEKDQLLAVKEPAVEGEDGITVTGKIISVPKPKDLDLSLFVGENVYLSESKNEILAACSGQPIFKDSKVHVKEVFVVDGDLGYSVGNINFNGTVVIRGNAEGPFKIVAREDVLINGILGEVEVECGGSLMVKGGIFGRSKGIIKVGKDLTAKFVNEARIFCKGKILVEEYIMNSIVVCGKDIFVAGRGIIAGGVVKAQGNITATELGSKAGVKTIVACGVNYETESKYEQCEIAAFEITKVLARIAEEEQKIRYKLVQAKEAKQREELRKNLSELEQKRFSLEKQLFKLKRVMNTLLQIRRLEGITINSKITLKGICHPGVKIIIGYESLKVQEELNVKEFYIDKSTGKIAYR
ncbi:DUF342 domain-containing protein [Pseudothermotoga thermarum]|uniref:Flagellar Assembly Protein A N-terminal region domain-containing protein n=1 Tax=Pseudothermotoga thermarum DSM 5069 TaxID=688269 RepID=F7YVU5_9THEM|nr:FapA family protein [Pseudothermotoga thermarum]AEH51767.1 protein of unknown function DUF342 [Pseudothermotoga thermarum DSM 5069]